MASQALKDKEQFFKDLYALDNLSSDDDAPATKATGRSQAEPRRSTRSSDRHSPRPASSVDSREDTRLRKRARTDTTSRERMPPPAQAVVPKPGPKQASSTETAPHSPSVVTRAQDVTVPTKKAKKKGPEIPQIFEGQTFFFVPNDNRSVPRKRRIDKAVLHGATWARAWTVSVTHIIVESGKRVADVMKATGQSSVPVAVVVDTWLTESLSYKEMRDCTARRFQLDPVPTPLAEVETRQDRHDESSEASSIRSEPAPAASQHREKDALDDLFEEVRATQHLPLDFGGDMTPTSSFEGEPTSSEPTSSEPGSDINKGFQCMLKSDGKTVDTNPNAATMKMLQEMASVYDSNGDLWRTLSYRKAIAALRKQKTKIETKEQARAIKQIGERLADKIEEIVTTNKLRRLDNEKSDPMAQVMRLFMGVYGVGLSVASKWVAQGHRTLEDVSTKADLTPAQRIGLEHYDDFKARIPRAEVAEHARIVGDALRKFDPKLEIIIGGSYRRGTADSGDIDCLITKEHADIEHIRNMVMESVVPFLTRIGVLKAALATTHSHKDGSKWHGASALPGSKVWRRIDLLFVPWDELGAALIYFTGNDLFNRSIRLLASKQNMRLNQHGLYADVMRGRNRERITEGKLLESRSEQKIFEILGVIWRPPEDRQAGVELS